MSDRNTLHTFVRLIALRYRWALGPYAARLTGAVAALPFDMAADVMRQICRWLFPIDSNIPVDALPHMLRLYGIPSYTPETYQATLARLRDAMATHHAAGSVAGIETEASRATGAVGPFTIVQEAGSGFWLRHPAMAAMRTWGDGGTYGRGRVYGYQPPSVEWVRNIAVAMRYFKPARERFYGLMADS